MMKTIDVMLDLETCGISPGCVVLSIGASTISGNEHFYTKISAESSKERGLFADPSTMMWWDRQKPEARQEAFSGTKTVEVALGEYADWMRSLGKKEDIYVWGNGADFDLPILAAVYKKVGMEAPWAPFNGRCYRTLKNLYKDIKAPLFEGLKHNALADAQHQAAHAHLIFKKHFGKE